MIGESLSDVAVFGRPGGFKVIYVYTINDGVHRGRLKIGDATFHTELPIEKLLANCIKVDDGLRVFEDF